MKTITTEQLHKKYESDNSIQLIDVRSALEFRTQHIPFAKNIPLGHISKEAVSEVVDNRKQTTHIVCHSGARSAMACHKLRKLGFENIANVEGGTAAWAHAGFPTEGDGSAIPAFSFFTPTGYLIVLGIILSLTVNPNFIILPALVGVYILLSARKAK